MELTDPAVLLVCEDAGAAEALAIVAARLAAAGRLRAVLAGASAAASFSGRDVPSKVIFEGDAAEDASLYRGRPVVLTGSTMWGTRMEARAVLAARSQGCSTVTFLDFWGNYVPRLSYPSETGMAAMPDRLAVVDEYMRMDLVAAGASDDRIVITGSPAFEELDRKPPLRSTPSGPVLFLSQPLESLYGTALGYSERSVLLALASALALEGRTLRVRPHPREDVVALAGLVAELPCQSSIVGGTVEETCEGASVVVGMTTMGLVVAAHRGMPTVSIQFGSVAPLLLPTIRRGQTRLVQDATDLRAALAPAVDSAPGRDDIGRPGATERIVALLDETTGGAGCVP